MQDNLYQTADVGALYQAAGAGFSLSDSGCKSLSIRQRMQETLYQTADAGDTLSNSGCRTLSIRQQMQETLYQTADAAYLHQTADA